LAILNEKGVQATWHSASALGTERLAAMLKAADLLVNPIHRKAPLHFSFELNEDETQAVLLYLNGR
jgi:hypothetical protein